MSRSTLTLLAFLTLLSPAAASGMPGWSNLKLGMSPLQTASALSVPVLRSAGKGFDVWIYDNRSEVVFFGGSVIGWTAPVVDPAAETPYLALSASVPPAIYMPFLRSIAPRRDQGADGYSLREILRYKAGR